MPQSHPGIPRNASSDKGASSSNRLVDGTPVCLATPVVPEDPGPDLFDSAFTLLRGWKTILGLMLIAGVVGAASISSKSGGYRASTVLHARVPWHSQVAAAAPLKGEKVVVPAVKEKIDLSILERYAGVFPAEENLQRAVEDAGLAGPDEPAYCLDQIKATVAVQPVKDSPDIEVSATLESPAEAERLVRALVQRGLASVETLRRQDADAVVQQLREARDVALEVFHEKRKKHRDLRSKMRLDEKQARLETLSQRLTAAQQAVLSNQVWLQQLEATIEAARELLKTTPPTKKQTYRLSEMPQFLSRLAEQLSVSPDSLSSLEVELQQANPPYRWLENSLTADEVALRGAKSVVKQSRAEVQSILQQIRTLRPELVEAEAELALTQWSLNAAREDWSAAEDAISRWKKKSDWKLPPLVPADPSQIELRQVGTQRFSRLVMIQIGAFMLGCMVVLVQSSYRRRTASQRPATGQALQGTTVRICETNPPARVSA